MTLAELIDEVARQWTARAYLRERERQLVTEIDRARTEIDLACVRLDEVRGMIVMFEKPGKPDRK